jgi:hypothetical protein
MMVSPVNQTLKSAAGPIAIAMLVLISFASHGQLFKKKKKTDDKRSNYAYQTYSTTQPKEKKKGYGSDGARFHFEKPLNPIEFGKIDRSVDYSKAPYFGHRKPPTRRPIGSFKLCKVCGIMH